MPIVQIRLLAYKKDVRIVFYSCKQIRNDNVLSFRVVPRIIHQSSRLLASVNGYFVPVYDRK
jgi:hypothetical protein